MRSSWSPRTGFPRLKHPQLWCPPGDPVKVQVRGGSNIRREGTRLVWSGMCHRASAQYETVGDGCDIVFKVLLDRDRSLLTPERLDGRLSLYQGDAPSHCNVLRPVHYLGNKQRSLSAILPHVAATVGPGDTVADLFTGTSVVAQSMASLGLNVVALDVSPACATMARATLGIGLGTNDDPEEIFETVARLAQGHLQELSSVFCRWIDAEDQAVAVADGGELLSLGQAIPQVWRHQPDDRLGALFDRWRSATRTGNPTPALLSPVYAGTYLGVRQAVTLDAYRAAVSESMRQCLLTRWQAQAMITSLLSAASRAAFTAGKHFAQPYKLGPRKNSAFHQSRILADRSVNILVHATRFLSHLVARARPATERHEVIEAPVGKPDGGCASVSWCTSRLRRSSLYSAAVFALLSPSRHLCHWTS